MLRYQDTWDSLIEARAQACITLRDKRDMLGSTKMHQADLDSIDEPLDVLDDVGFYMKGDRISPEVAHQHLYHWIRGYWFSAQSYISDWQSREPSRWEHLAFLFDQTNQIEAKRNKISKSTLALGNEAVADFLREEIDGGRSSQ